MPRIVRTRHPTRARWWSSLVAGAALGALGAWFVLRSSRQQSAPDPLARPRSRGPQREPDLEAMNARLRERAGAHDLELRSLGGGILELVGTAGAELDVPALLAALAAEPRVSVVVNRVWTPDSMATDADLEGPGARSAGEDRWPSNPAAQ